MVSMFSNSLMKPGGFFFAQGDKYRVKSIDTAIGKICALQLESQEQADFSYTDLSSDEDEGLFLYADSLSKLEQLLTEKQPLVEAINGTVLPKKWVEKAQKIIDIVETVQERLEAYESDAARRGASFQKTDALQEILENLNEPVSLTTYYKYRNLYWLQSGNLFQIAATFRRSTFNQLQVSSSQLFLVDTLIEEYYIGTNQKKKAEIYRIADSILRRTDGLWPHPDKCTGDAGRKLIEELLDDTVPIDAILAKAHYRDMLVETTCPSERWFYNYIKWFENQPNTGQAVIVGRYGEAEWETRYMVYESFIHKASRILQYVFADHWLIDVFILDEDDKPVRMWLTMLIDVYSRSVLGFVLLPHAPSIVSIQEALLHAIWPKESHKKLGFTDEWTCYGIIQHLSLDNAWAHHSHSLESLANSISMNNQYNSITLDFRRPYKGRYGAVIERLFGNFSKRMKQMLTGAIQSSARSDVRNARKEASLLYEDIYRFVHQIVLEYQNAPHSGLGGMTPEEKWKEGLAAGLPIIPKLTKGTRRLFWRMDAKSRTITSKGICAFGMTYWSAALNQAERLGKDGRPVEYTIRYHSENISVLAVFRDGRYIGDVYAKEMLEPDGKVAALSLVQRELAISMAKEAGQPSRNWLQFTNQWMRLNKVRAEEKKARAKAKASEPNLTIVENPTNTQPQYPFDDNDDSYMDNLYSNGA